MTIESASLSHGEVSDFRVGKTLTWDGRLGVFSDPFSYLSEFATAEVHRRKAAAHIAAAEFIESERAKSEAAAS